MHTPISRFHRRQDHGGQHQRRPLALPLGAAALACLLSVGGAYAGKLPRALSDHDFYDNGAPNAAKVELGRLLFHDKILSGNENISCASCHHPLTDTGDGLSLPVGEGGMGLGVTRDTGSAPDAVFERVPRNAPPIFNLGARQFARMFHDGRVAVDAEQPNGFLSPAGAALPAGLDNVLAVQAMFPVTSGTEMAGQALQGQAAENDQAAAAAAGDLPEVWRIIAEKLRAIDAYVPLFTDAFADVNGAADIQYTHAANAIAAFESTAWRADNSPFDRYLRGDRDAMSVAAKRGMRLFYGRAGCSGCHSGALQTDHDFHAIAMPQVGPGKGQGKNRHEDFGREAVTGDVEDRYRFRTPTLRNVALTGPWGHDGAYNTLRGVVEHHLDPVGALLDYDRTQLVLPSRPDLDAIDEICLDDEVVTLAIAAANELNPRHRLRRRQVDDLMDFLHALTDPASVDLRRDVPSRVPSGLPVFD